MNEEINNIKHIYNNKLQLNYFLILLSNYFPISKFLIFYVQSFFQISSILFRFLSFNACLNLTFIILMFWCFLRPGPSLPHCFQSCNNKYTVQMNWKSEYGELYSIEKSGNKVLHTIYSPLKKTQKVCSWKF